MNEIVIGAFYTQGTDYEKMADKFLIPSLKRHGLKHMVKARAKIGSWHRNVAEKPIIIREMLQEIHKDQCLVFVDVDCEFKKYPKLFEEIPIGYELAFHTLEWKTWYNRSNCTTKELLSGTLFLRNTQRIEWLCLNWYDEASRLNKWEQKALEKILTNHNVRCYNLPIEYCYVSSLPNKAKPHVKCDPVIVHHQASRRMKKVLRR